MKFKKRKVRKQRASTYHGWGKGAAHHKGSGNRGGKGRAGSGKRSDGKKPSFWKEIQGRHGFTSKNRMHLCAINIDQVESSLHGWEAEGLATRNGKGFQIDLGKAGYTKLLGSGSPRNALFITTDFASGNAVEKINEAGGQVTILKTIVKKEKKSAAPKKKEAKPDKEEKGGKGGDEE